MTTLATLTTAIQSVIQDDSYTDLTDRINDAVNTIAGGIRMPDGETSSPLPELYTSATIATTSAAERRWVLQLHVILETLLQEGPD